MTTGVARDQLRAFIERVERVSDIIAALDAVETWRAVPDRAGYEVSSWGQVRSRYRLLKPGRVHGYQVVSLSCNGEIKTARVHRLVAEEFLGPPPFDGAIVAHNDGDRENNRISNLRWASARENQFDRKRHDSTCKGSRVFGAKLQESDIPTIRQRIAAGETYRQIGTDYGVSASTIYLIRKKHTWQSAGGASWDISNER